MTTFALLIGVVLAPAPLLGIAGGGDPLTVPLDREVKDAQAYLEGWFGAPFALPPIDVGREDKPASLDSPGHFEGGRVRLRPVSLRREAELRRVLRHELAHAAVDQRTRGNCPVWVQEGLAQFLDGTNVLEAERLLRDGREPLVPLLRLEGPLMFSASNERLRAQAYRQSASAVSFLSTRIGRSGLLFIVDRLGEGRPFDRALLEAGLSYAELQQAWEASLARRSELGLPFGG